MRQIICNSSGAYVVRVPRPIANPGTLLVRVHYSWISVGTEIAPLRRTSSGSANSGEPVETLPTRLRRYATYSIRNPRVAGQRALSIVRSQLAAYEARRATPGSNTAAPETKAGTVTEETLTALDQVVQGWNVGYSAAGIVVAVGAGVRGFGIGDRVACVGAGEANHADYVSIRQRMVCKVPDGCSLELAASAAIGSIALQGVRRAQPQLGETACVIGLGLIGQITARLLHAAGCHVIGLDLDATRVERARTHGMDAGANSNQELLDRVRAATEGHGADITLIAAATKSDAVVNLAMEATRRKGRVVIVGDVGMNVERPAFYRKELDLLMSTSYGPGRYDPSFEEEGEDYPFAYVRWTLTRNIGAYLELIAAGRIDIASLIDRRVDANEAHAAYAELATGKDGLPVGVVLRFADESDSVQQPPIDGTSLTLRAAPELGDRVLRFALVGAGAFGTSTLVPQMHRRKDRFRIRSVVSRDTTRGGNYARANGVEIFSTDLAEVVADPHIDLVVIATRHQEHADQVCQALEGGKHVFVEKPLALSWEQLERTVSTYEGLDERPLLMVGFNRRFSPAMQMLASRIQSRSGPLVMNYRVNAGFIPLDHWIQGEHGGGRNLGEACHFYDCFRALAGAPVRSVAATSIDPDGSAYLRNDNFQATIGYADGSIGTLTYTAMGPTKGGLGKEYFEVFCDGEAYVLDDFVSLRRCSDGKMLWEQDTADKGHFEELSRFGDAIADGIQAPIGFGEIVETTAVTLDIEDILAGRVSTDDE